jgi:AraC-like DNA-binding protein
MESSGFTISTCLLQPFFKLLTNYQLSGPQQQHLRRVLESEQRIPIEQAHTLLAAAAALTGDADLGLKAGRLLDFEDGGVLAYASSAASTVRGAILVAARYMRLLTDAMDFRLEVEGARALVRLDSRVPLPRASADFQASALRTHHRRTHAMEIPGLEWWFTHPPPQSLAEYERTFGKAAVRFSMPCFAFVLDASFLDLPQATADVRQYEALITQLDAALCGLPRTSPYSDRVRDVVVRHLPTGQLSIVLAARELRISRRTLTRRLLEEGTSFTELLEDTRRRLALHYLKATDHKMSSIAFLLGFSDVATFYRAFKRWSASTPVQFRHAERPKLAPDERD